jgi:hypothetical protein
VGVINRIGDKAREAGGRIKELAENVAPSQEPKDEGTSDEGETVRKLKGDLKP